LLADLLFINFNEECEGKFPISFMLLNDYVGDDYYPESKFFYLVFNLGRGLYSLEFFFILKNGLSPAFLLVIDNLLPLYILFLIKF